MDQQAEPNQPAKEDAPRWRFGEVVLDERTMELSIGSVKVELPRKPLELLMFLVRNPNEVVTKDELFNAVWPGRIVSETSLFNAVRSLRTALGDEDEQQLIKSVYGYGYRFMGKVVREDARIASLPAPEPALNFKDGDPLPFRSGWVLRQRLGAGGGGDAWLGMALSTRETRVFKFARDHLALTALKREITLSRLMRESLGERPDLVRVLDWNLDEAPYFIAIDHCSEGSLSDWAEAHGGITAMPLDQRLELVAQAAEALAAAHTVGVLHKDIKPSNLLLHKSEAGRIKPKADPAGAASEALQLKLSDFGSARLIDRHRLDTLNIAELGFSRTIVIDASTGTPMYVAPELLEGSPPTILSDVYALGVVLYQLVAGDLRRSLTAGWEQRIEDPLLIEDIAAAAAGDPQRRLSDAAQLAARLRALPERREALAREQAARAEAERTRTALARSRARRSLWMALAASLVLGLAVTGFFLERARVEARRANAVTAFMTDDLLSAANPVVAGRRDVSMREVLDQAQQQLDQQFKDQPGVHATLARVIGSAYAAMGESEPALRLLTIAEKELSIQQGEAADETQAARTALREMYINQLDFPNLMKWSQRIAEVEQAAGTPHPEIAADAAGTVAIIQCTSGYFSVFVNRCDSTADRLYRNALARFGPDSLATLRLLAYRGTMLAYTERYAEALPLLRAANQGFRRIYGEDSLWMTQSEGLLATAMLGVGLAEEALPRIEQQLARKLRIYGPEHRQALVEHRYRARANFLLGHAETALAEQQDLLAIWLKKGDALRAVDYSPVALDLAASLIQLNRLPEAQTVIREALARIEPTQKPTGYETLRLREQLAHISELLKDDSTAERLLRLNLDQARAAMTHGEWLLGWDEFLLGQFLLARGNRDEATALLQSGHSILLAAVGPDAPRTRQAAALLP
ncbi:protein kinase domain-containing protein [Nevskia ramosa]|uniref:protein kinase domain-containing protein n=1 Tax=Nevskia ramosa TaxID=64002 RepID=UPI0003B6FE4C|nr:winged helix-turn-helix domain-containing protein [Nevskia ramosa]